MLETALAYLARGWSVFPLRGKRPLVDWDRWQCELPSREQVTSWWTEHPNAGIAVALGFVSKLMRIDVDGAEALCQLAIFGGFEPTAEFTTPTGGRGYLVQYLDGATTCRLWRGKGEHEELRVQSTGAYTVLPPSPHPDGGFYEWIRQEPVIPCPRWLNDIYVERALQALTQELRPTLRQPEREEVVEALKFMSSDDYDRWVQVGMALKTAGDEYFEVWQDWSRESPKFKEGECEKKWASFNKMGRVVTSRSIFHWAEQESGGKYRPPNRHEPMTDLGFARVLANVSAGRLRHSAKWGWLAWDGRRWDRSEGEGEKAAVRYQMDSLEVRFNAAVQSFVRHIQSDREAPEFEAKRKAKQRTMGAIRKNEDGNRMREARKLAEALPTVTVDYRLFDNHPLLLNCWNGTVNLRTEEFTPHDPDDMLTQVCRTVYDPDAICPLWTKFMEGILPDPTVREFLRLFLGSCLTGDTSPQIMPVFYGGGSNGKSTLIETVAFVLGEDYAMKAKRDLLMAKRNADHPTSLARLYRKRFVSCVETSEDGRLDEAAVKELTGGDTVTARRMREDEWEFEPTHKIVYATNHKPEIRGTDDGIWRRIPLVPFNVKFKEDDPNRDPDMKEKLKREAAGILRWMVEGCSAWLRAGKRLERPEIVKEATTAYREEQDRIGQFISDRCRTGDGIRGRAEKLMEAYTIWCSANHVQAVNGAAFSRALSERGYPLEAKGSKYRVGIDLAGAT